MGHKIDRKIFDAGENPKPKKFIFHEQQQSKLPRKGEGPTHKKAVKRLASIFPKAWEVIAPYPIWVNMNKGWIMDDKNKKSYYHEYDLYAEKKHTNGLISRYIFEIDGASHDSKVQQGHDRTAEEYSEFFEVHTQFYRIPIALLLNQSVSDESILQTYNIR